MSFACFSSVSPSELVTGGLVIVLLVVVVLGRHGCKMHENCELTGAALVVGVVAGTALVDLVAVGLVFRDAK